MTWKSSLRHRENRDSSDEQKNGGITQANRYEKTVCLMLELGLELGLG